MSHYTRFSLNVGSGFPDSARGCGTGTGTGTGTGRLSLTSRGVVVFHVGVDRIQRSLVEGPGPSSDQVSMHHELRAAAIEEEGRERPKPWPKPILTGLVGSSYRHRIIRHHPLR